MAKPTGSCLLLAALSAAGAGGCLLYTDHINHAPTVTLTGPTSADYGTQVTFRADAMDADQLRGSLEYEWHQTSGDPPACPQTLAEAMAAPVVGANEAELQVATDLPQSLCLVVIVRDHDGATDWMAQALTIVQRDPTAALDVVKPAPTDDDHYPLYSTIQLTSERSTDTEMTDAKLTRKFTLTHAGKTVELSTDPTALLRPCDQGPDTDVCLAPTEPGEYMIDLTVTDVRGKQNTAHKKVTIDPDAPPCIRQTAPQFGLPKFVRDPSDLTLEVDSVADDGDPFPFAAGQSMQNLTFEWSWWFEGSTGAHDIRPDRRRPQADFNGFFHAGDQVFIRLRVQDRVRRDFGACDPDKPTCALGKDATCFQWVTWKFDLRLGREQ